MNLTSVDRGGSRPVTSPRAGSRRAKRNTVTTTTASVVGMFHEAKMPFDPAKVAKDAKSAIFNRLTSPFSSGTHGALRAPVSTLSWISYRHATTVENANAASHQPSVQRK